MNGLESIYARNNVRKEQKEQIWQLSMKLSLHSDKKFLEYLRWKETQTIRNFALEKEILYLLDQLK